MANLRRLKRRMIRQAVRENLASERRGRQRRRGALGHRLLMAARLVFFVSLPAALFASTYVLTNRAAEWRQTPWPEAARGPQVAVGTSRSWRLPETAPSEPSRTGFTLPEPIDPAILPLTLRTIVLDPGHGGDNRGTMTAAGLVEKEVTLDIAKRLQEILEQRSYRVVMTRDRDESISLRERADLANLERGDIFISIHVNWIDNQEVRGVETFYLGPTSDPYLEALAARENQQSGYSLADLKDILQQVYAGVRQEESRRLARAVQEALYESLRKVNGELRNRGVKSAPFGVLTRTEMPAILAEVACFSNEVEARLLMTPIYRQYLAEALYQGIESYSADLLQASRMDG